MENENRIYMGNSKLDTSNIFSIESRYNLHSSKLNILTV